MAQWRVHVQGEQFDLEELREILADHDPTIIQDDSNFYLTSKEWTQSHDAREIHRRAKEFIQLLEDVAYFHSKDTAPLTIGGVVRIEDDGLRQDILIANKGSLTFHGDRPKATATVTGGDNRPVQVTQKHQVIKNLRMYEQNAVVRDALKFFREGDWVSFYKVYELVRDEVHGDHEIVSRNLISKKSLKRFTQMAQSREGLGDDARHASKKFKPPAKAMSLTEAKNTIGNLLQSWIDSL